MVLFVSSSNCRHPLISSDTLRAPRRGLGCSVGHVIPSMAPQKGLHADTFRLSSTSAMAAEAGPGASAGSLLTLRMMPADAVARVGAAYETAMNHDFGSSIGVWPAQRRLTEPTVTKHNEVTGASRGSSPARQSILK